MGTILDVGPMKKDAMEGNGGGARLKPRDRTDNDRNATREEKVEGLRMMRQTRISRVNKKGTNERSNR